MKARNRLPKYMTPTPSWAHQHAVWSFGPLLKSFVRERDLGSVAGAPVDILLSDGLATPVQPDVFFVSKKGRAQFYESHPPLPLRRAS